MKIESKLTINGNTNVHTFAERLRAIADQAEADALAMRDLGSNPPVIKDGNDLVFTFSVEGTV